MPTPQRIRESKQLVVEGRDAQVFFKALLNNLGLSGIQTQNFGGINELKGFLKALCLAPEFATRVISLGVVRDAESNPASALQSVGSALGSAGLPVPPQAMAPHGSHPRVSVLILPDATSPGMLETLCLQSVRDDPLIPCVDDFFDCVEQLGSLPTNMDKARAHAYLATRPRPDLLIGQAAHAGYWPWSSPVFAPVEQFLQSL